MPIGLYNGLSGIALFFAHLGRLTDGERYERLARLALATIEQRIAGDPGPLVRPGAYGGWGGIVYVLTHLGLLWDEPELLEKAESLAGLLVSRLDEDDAYDLIAGAAGGAAALLAVIPGARRGRRLARLHCHVTVRVFASKPCRVRGLPYLDH